MGVIFIRTEGFEHFNVSVQWTLTCRTLGGNSLISQIPPAQSEKEPHPSG